MPPRQQHISFSLSPCPHRVPHNFCPIAERWFGAHPFAFFFLHYSSSDLCYAAAMHGNFAERRLEFQLFWVLWA